MLSFCTHRFVRRSGFIGFESSRCFTRYALGGLACLLDWGRPAASVRAQGIRRATVNTFGYIAKAIGPQDVLTTLLNNLRVQAMQCNAPSGPCPARPRVPHGTARSAAHALPPTTAIAPSVQPLCYVPNGTAHRTAQCRVLALLQERQNRVCTTVAIGIVAETCSPFTVRIPSLSNYRLPLPPRRAARLGLPGLLLG